MLAYRLSEIIDTIEKTYPRNLALDWDNPGLICGRRDKEINTAYICLDADNLNIDRALKDNADLILSHHPMIFGSIRQINDGTALGLKLLRLIENGTACYAMHTNYDIAVEGMCKETARRLNAMPLSPLEITGASDDGELGVGFVYELNGEGCTAKELSMTVKKAFGLDTLWYYDGGRKIRRVAVCPGSGRKMMDVVLAQGADAFITGDTGHHDGLDYKDAGITLIDAGHYGIEKTYIDAMYKFMHEHFPDIKLIKGAEDEREFI